MTSNDFPKLGIQTQELIDEITRLIEEARKEKANFPGVNWADIGVAEIEYRISVLRPSDGPYCAVILEEASPHCGLAAWIMDRLDRERFPNVQIECEW